MTAKQWTWKSYNPGGFGPHDIGLLLEELEAAHREVDGMRAREIELHKELGRLRGLTRVRPGSSGDEIETAPPPIEAAPVKSASRSTPPVEQRIAERPGPEHPDDLASRLDKARRTKRCACGCGKKLGRLDRIWMEHAVMIRDATHRLQALYTLTTDQDQLLEIARFISNGQIEAEDIESWVHHRKQVTLNPRRVSEWLKVAAGVLSDPSVGQASSDVPPPA